MDDHHKAVSVALPQPAHERENEHHFHDADCQHDRWAKIADKIKLLIDVSGMVRRNKFIQRPREHNDKNAGAVPSACCALKAKAVLPPANATKAIRLGGQRNLYALVFECHSENGALKMSKNL